MKASSGGQYSSPQEGRRGGGEGLTVGCLILLSYRPRCIITARLYQEERSLSGDSSKEHACGSVMLSSFLFLIQLVSSFPSEQRLSKCTAPCLLVYLSHFQPKISALLPADRSGAAFRGRRLIANLPRPQRGFV